MNVLRHWGEDDPEVQRVACALSFYYDGDAGNADDWIGGAAAALSATNLRGAVDRIKALRGNVNPAHPDDREAAYARGYRTGVADALERLAGGQ